MRIPEYERSVGYQTPTVPTVPAVHPVVGAFGGRVEEAQQRVADKVIDITEKINSHLLERQKQKYESYINDLDTSYRRSAQDRLFNQGMQKVSKNGQEYEIPAGILNRQGNQVDGSFQEFKDWHIKQRDQILAGVTNEEYRDKLSQSIDGQFLTLSNHVVQNEVSEKNKIVLNSFTQNIEQKIHDSGMITKPDELNKAIDGIQDTQAQASNFVGDDEKTMKNKQITMAEKPVEVAITRALVDDPTGARATELLASVKGRINEDKYNEFNKDIIDTVKTAKRTAEHDQQEIVRNKLDELNTAFLNDGLTARDIYDAAPIIGGKAARGLKDQLFAKQNTKLKAITTEDEQQQKYIDLVDSVFSDEADRYSLKNVLVSSYADGSINGQEAQQLDQVKKIMEDMRFNNESGVMNGAIKTVKGWFGQHNPDNKSLVASLKKVINFNPDLKKTDEEITDFTNSLIKSEAVKLNPKIGSLPDTGKIMIDANGNKAKVYPDGRYEEIVEPTKEENNALRSKNSGGSK